MRRERRTWCSVTTREPEQKPPPALRPVAIEPTSMSTSAAWVKKEKKVSNEAN